jgi:hypothetical protein
MITDNINYELQSVVYFTGSHYYVDVKNPNLRLSDEI